MSNGIKNSNLFTRIITITLLISLFFFLGLSLPGYAYGDSKEGMVIADTDDDVNEVEDDVNEVDDDVNEVDDDVNEVDDDVNEVDDCTDINGICSDDDCDCTDDNGKCVDDCAGINNINSISNAEKTKNTNSNSIVADDTLKDIETINMNSSVGPLEVKKIRETKTSDDILKLKSVVPVSISEIEANQQLGAKETVKLFFENVTLFFTNLLDKII
jgi:hypothetical protein